MNNNFKNRFLEFEKEFMALDNISARVSEFRFLSKDIMKRYCFVPIDTDDEYAYIAMVEPEDTQTVEKIRILLGKQIYVIPSSKEQIYTLINTYEDMKNTDLMLGQFRKLENKSVDQKSLPESKSELIETSPAVRISNSIIIQAINTRASDIHIEIFENEALVRYRVDGVLSDNLTLPVSLYQSICSKIKLDANMDIAERRIPQDGKSKFKHENTCYDLRVSTLPTIYGEKIVIRILYKDEKILNLNSLGFSKESTNSIIDSLNSSYGMIIVTGPTGSGKTTTLYSMISEMDRYHKNIVAIENPSEIFLARVNQVNVNNKSGLTFANGLKSILRQDPDVIMVGEIRDSETAQIAIGAAITGHLVLSTLHTNDAAASVTRLMDMGVASYLLADSLIGCIAQRLVRKICSYCKTTYMPTETEQVSLGISSNTALFKGKGCIFCNYTGYKYRTVVSEIMNINSEMKSLISKGSCSEELRAFNKKLGMKTIRENGVEIVKQGVTTYEEFAKLLNNSC